MFLLLLQIHTQWSSFQNKILFSNFIKSNHSVTCFFFHPRAHFFMPLRFFCVDKCSFSCLSIFIIEFLFIYPFSFGWAFRFFQLFTVVQWTFFMYLFVHLCMTFSWLVIFKPFEHLQNNVKFLFTSLHTFSWQAVDKQNF